MSNSMLEALDAEIGELEAVIYKDADSDKKGEDEPSGDEPIGDEPTDGEADDPGDGEVTPEDLSKGSEQEDEVLAPIEELDPELEEPKQKKRVSYKSLYLEMEKRFKGLRNARDARVMEANRNVQSLTAEVSTLTGVVKDLQEKLNSQSEQIDIYKDVFSEEDVEAVGEDAINVMKKATNRIVESAVNPLKEQLAKSEEEALRIKQEAARTIETQEAAEFFDRLEAVVTDYKTIDVDPAFSEYVKGYDESSGLQRLTLLKQAQSYGDVYRVAQFFNDFKAIKAQPTSKLEEKVLPGSKPAVTIETKGKDPKLISLNEYSEFYDKLTRGGFKNNPKKGEELEAYYDKAYAEGRIV